MNHVAAAGLAERIWALISQECGATFAEPAANFYECGGDSLLAVEFMTALQQELAVEVPMRFLFGAPDMAHFVDAVVSAVSQIP